MKRWVLRVVYLLAPALVFFTISQWNEDSHVDRPLEDPYWFVAQFDSYLWRLKSDLLLVTSNEPIEQREALTSLAVALSKLRLLTRASPAQEMLLRDQVFQEALPTLQRFETVLDAAYKADVIDPIQARFVLSEIMNVTPLVTRVGASVWQMQVAINDSAFVSSQARIRHNKLLANGLAIYCALLLAALVYVDKVLSLRADTLKAQKKVLEDSIKEKNQFMGMVSHELKSPLQTISSSTEILLTPIDPVKRHQVIQRIQRATARMQSQINDLLTLARSEAGALEYRAELFEVNSLLEEIVEIESQLAYDKSLSIHLELPSEPVFVVADANRFAQIIGNLVNNAIKYTDMGSVTVSLQHYDDHLAHFRVSDTGPGMPSGFAPLEIQTFKRFATMGKSEGYGVGLKIAFSLAEYLGGSLSYTSSEAGTVFDLKLPAELQYDAEHLAKQNTKGLRVLLVDDNDDLLAALHAECESLGVYARVAQSAAAAANMMASEHFDVALIDVNMPGRRGDELARDFRRGSLMRNPECLLIGMSAQEHPELAKRSPFHQLLEKPIRIKSVLRAHPHPKTSGSTSEMRL